MATNNSKKPQPAQRPNTNAAKPGQKPAPQQHAAPAKPAPARDVDDDLDVDLAETSEESTSGDVADKVDFNKLPPAKRIAVRLGNEVQRLQKQFDAIKNWPDVAGSDSVTKSRDNVAAGLACLKSAAEGLAGLPDDYRPRVAKSSTSAKGRDIAPNDLVMITDKRREEYAGVLEPDQMTGIKVVELRGNKVVATTKDGMRAMFARGHVCLDEASMAARSQPSA